MMVEFTINPVKSKPVRAKTRARKGADKTKDIKTCYDCQFCFLTGEQVEGLKKYKCSKEPSVTKVIAIIMHHCKHLYPQKKSTGQPTADYIQETYREIRERIKDNE